MHHSGFIYTGISLILSLALALLGLQSPSKENQSCRFIFNLYSDKEIGERKDKLIGKAHLREFLIFAGKRVVRAEEQETKSQPIRE